MEPLQSTLLAHLQQVPDFRKARGQRFAWSYLLALVAAAVAAGQTTALGMTAWAGRHAAHLITVLQPGVSPDSQRSHLAASGGAH
jgi:hypothetical protein